MTKARTMLASLMLAAPVAAGAMLVGACAGNAQTKRPPQEEQFTRAVSAPARLDPPASLPNEARALLKTRMGAHARDMGDLMEAIMVLNYPRIQERADAIAADVSLARPFTGDATELNSLLPEAFFEHQDALKTEAKALSIAAESQSAFAVADAYGRVSERCVRCHGVYRQGQP